MKSDLKPPEDLKHYKLLSKEAADRGYMRLLNCHFTDRQIRFMNNLVEEGYYPNRSELIRDALRSLQQFYSTIWLSMNGGKEE